MIRQQRLAGLDWFIVRGESATAFAELGRACADRIKAVLAGPSMPALRERAERSPHFTGVLAASRRTPAHAELCALAEGAGVPLAELEILNLRGDLGTDPLGCTDVAVRGERGLVVAHNEDGPPEFDCVALTLGLEDRAAIWVFWTPGMLPSNSFVVNELSLAYGCDSITVTQPALAPGRHFVARGLADCWSLDGALEYLRENPSAGGFHYALTDWRTGEYVGVESVAGQYAELPADPEVSWHTNHLRGLDGLDVPAENSLIRAETAAGWTLPEEDPVKWCVTQLARRRMPAGVYRGADTLGTMVLDCGAMPPRLTLVPGRPPRRAVTKGIDQLIDAAGHAECPPRRR